MTDNLRDKILGFLSFIDWGADQVINQVMQEIRPKTIREKLSLKFKFYLNLSPALFFHLLNSLHEKLFFVENTWCSDMKTKYGKRAAKPWICLHPEILKDTKDFAGNLLRLIIYKSRT